MKKLNALLTSLLMAVNCTVLPVTFCVSAEETVSLTAEETFSENTSSEEPSVTTVTTSYTGLTTTATTTVATNLIEEKGRPEDFNLVGKIFFDSYEYFYYQGDELDLSKTTFTVRATEEENADDNVKYINDNFKCQFSLASGEHSDCYEIDSSEVDTSKVGKYKVYLRTKGDVTDSFQFFPPSKSKYPTGEYNVRMIENTTYFVVQVLSRPDFIDKPVSMSTDIAEFALTSQPQWSYVTFSTKENVDFEVESDDESIVRIEGVREPVKANSKYFPELYYVDIKPLKVGETKIRVTSSDGFSLERTIRVYDDSDIVATTTTAVFTEAFNTTTLPNTQTTVSVVKGDANCDGNVTLADCVAVLQYLSNAEKYPLTVQGKFNADVDGQDGISGNDALVIQRYDSQ